MLIVAGNNSEQLCRRIAEGTGSQIGEVEKRRFPDGELYIRVKTPLEKEDVAIVSDTRSDGGIIHTMLLVDAASGMKPRRLTLIIPYFSYGRQHMRYKPGEPISSKVLVTLFTNYVDRMATIEIHDEETIGFSKIPFSNLKVYHSVAEYYRNRKLDMVVSPDDGGYNRARSIADLLGIEATYFNKIRTDPKNVTMEPPSDINFNGKRVLIFDDIISTGGTIMKSIELLRSLGASYIAVGAVHGLFANNGHERIASLADELSVTNTVAGAYSKIDVSQEIIKYLKGENGGK